MAHALEQAADGRTAFADSRSDAWHQLGQQVGHLMTAQEVLAEAHLAGWNVRKHAVALVGHPDIVVDRQYAVIRDNPFEPGKIDVLGRSAGEHYHPFQNEESAELLDTITDEFGGAHYETAGSLNDGRNTFVTMKVPQTMNIGGVDPVDTYLVALNSHDGQSSFQFMVTPVRIVCANTQAAAVRQAKAIFKVRHTRGGAGAVLSQAREALGLTFKYMEEFEKEAQKLIEQEYTNNQFVRLTASLFPTPDDASDKQVENAKVHRLALTDLFKSSPTATEIRGTRWAAYQAVTEYFDHVIDKRGAVGQAASFDRAKAAVSQISPAVKTKQRAFELLTAAR